MPYVVGSAEVELVPSAQGFDEKANALLKDLKVNVILNADTTKVRAELATLRDEHVDVKADADTTVARAELDSLALPREAPVKVSTPGLPAAQSGIGLLAGGIGVLVSALVPLGGGLLAMTLGLTAMAGAATVGVGAFAALVMGAIALDSQFKSKLMPSLNSLKSVFDKFVNANSGALLKPLQDGIKLLSSLLPPLSPIIRAASSAIDSLLKPLQAAVNNGTFSRWASEMATLVGPAITGFGKIIGNLVLGFGQLLAAFAPLGKQLLAGLVSMTGQFAKIGQSPEFKAFVKWAIAQVPLVSDVLKTLIKDAGGLLVALAPFGRVVLSFIDALLGGSKGMSSFNSSLNAFVAKLPSMANSAVDLLGRIVGVVMQTAPKLVPAAVKLIGAFSDALAKGLPTILPVIVTGLTKLIIAVNAVIPSLIAPAMRLVDGILSALLQPASAELMKLLPKLMVNVGPGLIVGIGQSIAKNAPAILNAFLALGPIFAQAGVDLWNKGWSQTLGGLGKNIGNWFSTDLPNFIGDALKNIGSWLLSAGDLLLKGLFDGVVIGFAIVRDLFFTWPGKIASWLAKAVPTFLKGAGDWLKSLWNGIVRGAENVWNWFLALPGRIGAFLAGAPRWLLQAGINLLHGLQSGVVNGWNAVVSWFRALPGRIAAFGRGALDWLGHVGHDLVQGFLNGIIGAWHAVTSWIHSAIDLIPAGIRKALGINSPSTVAMEIGDYFGQGLGIGMQRSIADAADSASQLMADKSKSMAMNARVSASVTAGTSQLAAAASANGRVEALLKRIADGTKTVADKTASAMDIARATRMQGRNGGAIA